MFKRKILFLTTQLPYPPNSGGTVKSWNYVKHLSTKHELSVGTLLKDEDQEHENEFLENIELSAYISEPINIPRSPINLIRSYLAAPCLNVFRNRSSLFAKKVEKLTRDADCIVVDHYEVFQFVPKGFTGKVIMHTHNAEFMLWQRMAELSSNAIKSLVLKLESKRVKKYEEEIFSQSDLIYSTPSDIELYANHGIDTRKHEVTYHLGNDTLLELPDLNIDETELAISFMGTLSWEPNIDGLVWFIKNVWPIIKLSEPTVVFYIMGKNPDARIVEAINSDPNIILTGFVKDLDTYLKKTRAYIAPLRFGSGMKVKVLEGLYRGVPSVVTTVAAEGLAIETGVNIFIEDKPEAFAEACKILLKEESTWNRFRDKSRAIARNKYTWAMLFKQMDQSLEKLN